MDSPDPSSHVNWPLFSSAGWVETAIDADGDVTCRPPACLILYRDLLEKGWGWDRLVPYNEGSVHWSEFKDYLETYFQKNEHQIANLCNCQNNGLLVGQSVAAENFLQAAAIQCIEIEHMIIRNCWKYLTVEDIRLCGQIKKHARLIIQSEVVSSAATAGLACVIKEAELMCKSVELECIREPSEIIIFSNVIRRSALNLIMLNGGTESQNAAALAAMVGMAKEAKYLCDLLSQEDPDMHVKYLNCDDMWKHTATVLTMLEKEFGCGSDGNADTNGSPASNTSEKSIGVSAISGLNGDESGSEENSRGIIEHCVKDNAKEEVKLT